MISWHRIAHPGKRDRYMHVAEKILCQDNTLCLDDIPFPGFHFRLLLTHVRLHAMLQLVDLCKRWHLGGKGKA